MSIQYDFKSDKLIDADYNCEVFDEKDKRAKELGMGTDKEDEENRYIGTKEQWNKLEKI